MAVPAVLAMTAVMSLVLGVTEGLDVGTMLASYGIAAPFAALCFWVMVRSSTKLDASLAKIEELQAAAVAREKDFAQRLAPLLYDGALLYRQGNERLTQGLASQGGDEDELRSLVGRVDEMLTRLADDHGGGDHNRERP